MIALGACARDTTVAVAVALGTTKLRNSCDACTAAKIKCTQEKPACGYCVRRQKGCVYGPNKRVRNTLRRSTNERAREHSEPPTATVTAMGTATATATAIVTAPSTSSTSTATSTGTSLGLEMHTSGSSEHCTPALLGQDWPDFLSPLTTLTSPGTTSPPTESAMSIDWASLGASGDLFTYLNNDDFDFSVPYSSANQKMPQDTTNVVSTSSIFNDTSTSNRGLSTSSGHHGVFSSETITALVDMQASASFAPPATSAGDSSPPRVASRPDSCQISMSNATPPISHCQCSLVIIQYLAKMSMDPSEAWRASPHGDALTQPLRFEQIYDQIETMSVKMGRILECPCTNDSYLLLLLSLVILRIQVWYTAAVNAATREASETLDGPDANTTDSHLKFMLPSSWTDLDDDDESQGEDKRRIFVQHVLSRLTGLQILISRLFQCIANAEAESSLSATLALAAQGPLCPVLKDQIPIVPFSFPLLRALLSDVHGRLGRLSRAVAEKLRA